MNRGRWHGSVCARQGNSGCGKTDQRIANVVRKEAFPDPDRTSATRAGVFTHRHGIVVT